MLLAGILASYARAALIDDEDINLGYTAEPDNSASTDNIALTVPGDTGQAVQLNYNFATTDSYSQLTKNFSRFNMGELARSDVALRFYARGSGSSNAVRVRLTDIDGDQLFKVVNGLTNNDAWASVSIPLSAFTLSALGNGKFDLFRVTQLEIAVEKTGGGSGALDIDGIGLFRTQASTGVSILLDGFEGGTGSVNQFGAGPDVFTQDVNASISAVYDTSAGNAAVGTTALKITYNAGTTAGVDNAGYFNSPNGANLTPATQLEFYAKASNDNEAFRLTFGSATSQYQVINIGGISKSWQKFTIPFNNFDQIVTSGAAGLTGFSYVTAFVMAFAPSISVGSGNLWLDDIRFTAPAASSGDFKTIDAMEEPVSPALTTWEAAYDVSSFASFSGVADGVSGRALRMTYSLSDGTYATMVRKFYVNASLADAIRFKYKTSGALTSGVAALNTFEFHVLDKDGTHYKRALTGFASTAGTWKTLVLPLKEFSQVSGDSSLDLRKLKEMRFTMLKSDGGKGILAVDQFEAVASPKLTQGATDRLIQSISTDNNPFSPNDDGVKDTVTFSYTLKEPCKVRLRIYGQDGQVVKEFSPADAIPAGAGSFAWDGKDSGNVRIRNGLYFFQLKADATGSGNKDKETNIVAVLR